MKQLFALIHKKVRKSYYYQEIKELGSIGLIALLVWVLYKYGKSIADWLFTEKGLTYTCFFFMAVVFSLALKLYYRIMAIKYHEKDTRIKMFEYLHKSKTTILLIVFSIQASVALAQHMQHRAASGRGYADSVNKGLIAKDTMKGSPVRMAMNTVGGTHIHMEYGSPGVKGRIIWGGLVAYDQVWVAGAHRATKIIFSKDVIINAKLVKAGTYALFMIPGKQQFTVIINRKWDQHLADEYNAKDDVLRVNISPTYVKESVQRLTYSIAKIAAEKAAIEFRWEKTVVVIPVNIK